MADVRTQQARERAAGPMRNQPTEALKERLYAALKHSKGCSCGECSGGLNAVDALADRVAALETENERWRLLHEGAWHRLSPTVRRVYMEAYREAEAALAGAAAEPETPA